MKGLITLGIVTVFLVYAIFVLAMKSKQSGKEVVEWPPHISRCPEYWDLTKSGQCVNEKKINVSDSSNVNFDTVDSYKAETENLLSILSTEEMFLIILGMD